MYMENNISIYLKYKGDKTIFLYNLSIKGIKQYFYITQV